MRDVIVVGAGPVGSRCAARLADHGWDILLLEARPEISGKLSCTGLISRTCANEFEIPPDAMRRDAGSARLYAPSGDSLHIYREEPQACVIDRLIFDNFMAGQAINAGAELRYGHRVTGITTERRSMRVSFSYEGRNAGIEARVVIIASGCSPRLTEAAGLGKPARIIAGAQATAGTNASGEVAIYTGSRFTGFFGWRVPAEPGKERIGLMASKNACGRLKKWLEALASEGRIIAADVPIYTGAVPLSPLPRTYGERVIAVGDAAGQVKPTSGGGIYYGLMAADIAAEAINEALRRDNLSASFLRRYEKRWKEKFGQEIRHGQYARRCYEKLDDRKLDRLITAARKAGLEKAIQEASGIDFDRHSQTAKHLITWHNFSLPRGMIKNMLRKEKEA